MLYELLKYGIVDDEIEKAILYYETISYDLGLRFENEIEKAVLKHSSAKYIFVEQKPSSIGKRKIPGWLYAKMNDGIFVLLDVDKKIRINNILNTK